MKVRTLELEGPLDLVGIMRPTTKGRTTGVWSDGGWWRASRTPCGPVTLHLAPVTGGVRCTAWGEGADWALEQVPELLGLHDEPEAFDPPPGPVRDLWRRHPGQRFGRTTRVLEALLPTILAQKVTTRGAITSWHRLVSRWGEPAPGPAPLRLPPIPREIARLGYAALHPVGVERKRAETLLRACHHAHRLEQTVGMQPEDAYRRLQAVRGVGPWTAALVGAVAFGDADAVPIGDYHLPNTVAWVLAGEARADDARMLELLEPYRGHRGRVLRLIARARVHAPRRGPPLAVNDIRGR